MKILHIIDTLTLGGAQTVVRGILERNKDNNQYFLYVLRETNNTYKIDHSNVFIHPTSYRYSLKPLKDLRNIIEKEGIVALHCHLFRSMVFGWILKKLYYPDIKLIFHEHGRIFTNIIIYRLFIKLSIFQTDLYLAVSKATKRRLISNAGVPQNKIKTLYNFVDLDKYNRKFIAWNAEEEKVKLAIDRDEFVVGFAGRLVERKGWRTFINAAELVLVKQPNIKFLIAGDGKDKQVLIDLINTKKLSKNIIFLGYVSEMVWFYSLLDCFVIPSFWEPMGLTEIEAQAMGIPVISSDVEALNEIIVHGENGLLFNVKDEKDLTENINKLIIDDELRQLLVFGGHKTVKGFSLYNHSIKLEKLYNELL